MASSPYLPESGDIIWLELDPRTGHEQSGRRPCLVLSDRLLHERTGLAVVCPITSKAKGLPYEVPLTGAKTQGAVLPIHLRSIDLQARYARFIEPAPVAVLQTVQRYVRVLVGSVE